MLDECEPLFPRAGLISLGDQFSEQANERNGSTGLDVANFLCRFSRVCPVIVHASDSDCAWAIQNELQFAGWAVKRVAPGGPDWLERDWLPIARQVIDATRTLSVVFRRPADHGVRTERALTCLTALSVADALAVSLGAM
jgi:hypothetical protein